MDRVGKLARFPRNPDMEKTKIFRFLQFDILEYSRIFKKNFILVRILTFAIIVTETPIKDPKAQRTTEKGFQTDALETANRVKANHVTANQRIDLKTHLANQ